ncbi:MAG: bifunctional serine/threonine-protein kinase/formylglycine-generating enzyme family protein [Vicinamibacterales bacterium]
METIGTMLGHYEIDARLGQGGMGTVYRARDTVLTRTVAIKVLSSVDPDSARRLLHEARSASALNHPNIVTIYSVEQHDATAFIVMEYVEGESLSRAIPPGGLDIDRALKFACDIAHALAAAHELGIIHRDIKPGNVMVTSEGQVKVLDFGIARRTALAESATQTVTMQGTISEPGQLVGTPGYLAPEQIRGEPASPQSDVFALGAVIHQMITGAPPFAGGSSWAVIDTTLNREPAPLASIRPDVPAELVRIVARCLDKDPAQRPATARQLYVELERVKQDRTPSADGTRTRVPRMAVVAGVMLLLVGIGAVIRWQIHERRLLQAHAAIPEITRLAEEGDPVGAYRLARQSIATAPDDVQLQTSWQQLTQPLDVNSTPPGADLAFRSYSGTDPGGWIEVGKTPLNARIPLGLLRWRISRDGYESQEIAPNPFPIQIVLVPKGSSPAGMVHVPAGSFALDRRGAKSVDLAEYWIDTFEVTNRQFKAFVDADGYRKPEYWAEAFVKDGRPLSWELAMDQFRDSTGRHGPSNWETGAYRDGEDDMPVGGVSWYEAAAYANFAGKALPTVHHWYAASGAFSPFSEILSFSNFGGKGPVKGGASGGLGPFGTHDMAGNMKEWTWNETDGQRRFVLGGAFNEATYQFHDADARSPFERGPGFGFRCILLPVPIDARLKAPVETLERDPALLIPVDDDVYRGYKSLYDYDPLPLESKLEERDDTNAHWTMERVTVRAAYGTERVPIMLFLPRSAKPPYQVVV